MKIPEYFPDAELACRCGCGYMPPERSVHRLYALRLLWGKPMTITSAARCANHNRAVGGAAASAHLCSNGGCGYDVRVPPERFDELEALAIKCGFRGFGRAKTFLHIDDMPRPAITRWTY